MPIWRQDIIWSNHIFSSGSMWYICRWWNIQISKCHFELALIQTNVPGNVKSVCSHWLVSGRYVNMNPWCGMYLCIIFHLIMRLKAHEKLPLYVPCVSIHQAIRHSARSRQIMKFREMGLMFPDRDNHFYETMEFWTLPKIHIQSNRGHYCAVS